MNLSKQKKTKKTKTKMLIQKADREPFEKLLAVPGKHNLNLKER